MNNIKGFSQFVNEIINASYTQEWPLNKQEIGVNQNDVESDPDYAKKENKFQEVQDQMKIILKPMLLKKNPNANEHDVEKVSDSFFNLGGERAAQVKKMVDNCKDTKQCAQDIVNKYYKYVKINFGTKDNTNDVEQDAVMSSESVRNNTTNVCEECDGRGYTDKGRCKACNGTGLSRPRRKVKTGLVKIKKI